VSHFSGSVGHATIFRWMLIALPAAPERICKWGHQSGANVGGGHRSGAKRRKKNLLVVPLHFLARKAQLVVLVNAFVIISTVWSVYCLLFFYSRCPRAQPFVNVGARAPRAPWRRRHCSLLRTVYGGMVGVTIRFSVWFVSGYAQIFFTTFRYHCTLLTCSGLYLLTYLLFTLSHSASRSQWLNSPSHLQNTLNWKIPGKSPIQDVQITESKHLGTVNHRINRSRARRPRMISGER